MITLSSHQKSQIALATLGHERAKVGVFTFDRGVNVGVEVGIGVAVNKYWQQTVIAVANRERATEYANAITAYLDELYTERT